MTSCWHTQIPTDLNAHKDGIGGQMFPFGGGPRFCPGRFLAMAEIRMAVSMLARHFHMALDASAPPVEELFTFTMTPDSLPIRLTERAGISG